MRPPPTCPPIECIAFYYSNCLARVCVCVCCDINTSALAEINTLHTHTLGTHTARCNLWTESPGGGQIQFHVSRAAPNYRPFVPATLSRRMRAVSHEPNGQQPSTHTAAEHTHRMFRNYYANASIRCLCDRANFPRLT